MDEFLIASVWETLFSVPQAQLNDPHEPLHQGIDLSRFLGTIRPSESTGCIVSVHGCVGVTGLCHVTWYHDRIIIGNSAFHDQFWPPQQNQLILFLNTKHDIAIKVCKSCTQLIQKCIISSIHEIVTIWWTWFIIVVYLFVAVCKGVSIGKKKKK